MTIIDGTQWLSREYTIYPSASKTTHIVGYYLMREGKKVLIATVSREEEFSNLRYLFNINQKTRSDISVRLEPQLVGDAIDALTEFGLREMKLPISASSKSDLVEEIRNVGKALIDYVAEEVLKTPTQYAA